MLAGIKTQFGFHQTVGPAKPLERGIVVAAVRCNLRQAKQNIGLYERLASGKRLDEAVLEARRALFEDDQRDWGNYLLYGEGRFRLVKGED